MSEFYVGQKVWSHGHSVGVIEEIYPGEAFPVVVKFNDGFTLSYTSDGRYYAECDVELFPYPAKGTRGIESTKPTIAFMRKIVYAFYELAGNDVGGNLHIVTDDLNVETHHVEWCREQARQVGDQDGVFLAEMLMQFTEAEREEICL